MSRDRVVFPTSESVDAQFQNLPKESIIGKRLTPVDFEPKAEPYLIEISPDKSLPSHFFVHKGEEIGYLLSGELYLKLKNEVHTVQAGHVIYLTTEMPSEWKNPGPDPARLLWLKIK
jgi:quercetin dioxygenase-like cupin family protein